MKRTVTIFGLLLAALLVQTPARAQSLPNQVLALYPQRTGELIFVDVRALRGSRHYEQLKRQVLPERFRQLEQWVQALGIDLDGAVRQMSWAFVPAADGGAGIAFVGVAEGDFSLREVEQQARRLQLGVSRSDSNLVVSLGKNEQGQEFVFAFLDGTTAIFGFREAAVEILGRRAQGGSSSLLTNATVRDGVGQLNGKAPLWIVLDKQFSALALKQMLPEASQVPGFEAVTGRIQSTTLSFELQNGMRSLAAVRCADSSDALLFSTATQAAVSYQALRLNDTNPDLARVLGQMKLSRQDDRMNMELSVAESELVTLLQKNSFVLKF